LSAAQCFPAAAEVTVSAEAAARLESTLPFNSSETVASEKTVLFMGCSLRLRHKLNRVVFRVFDVAGESNGEFSVVACYFRGRGRGS